MAKRAAPSKLQTALTQELKKRGSKQRAAQQQAYMKSALPFAGVAAPELRALQRELFPAYPLATNAEWQTTVLTLFRTAPFRELRYVAIELAYHKPYRQWLTTDAWDMLDELVTTGAWWDAIDALAPNHYAHLLATEPRTVKPRLRSYATDPNIWRRRVAILCQLKAKTDTDERLLFGAINKSLDHPEFFVRKAIGWALRAHSRINPDGVIDYVNKNAHRLSPLSQREALKHLRAKGLLPPK